MRSALPETLDPQLATLASRPPSAAGLWKYEIKFDGYRILARVENGRCKLFTRNRNDWTSKLQSLAKAVTRLDLKSAWLDCEAVVMGPAGVPSFNALQNAFDGKATGQIQLFVFDVPFLDGDDLRSRPLSERRRILKSVLSTSSDDRLRLSDEFDAPGASILETACAMGLEGVIAKRQDAPYVSGRTDTWLKLKCHQRQEFVIGGFTDRVNSSSQLGSLLLGVYDDAGALVSVGSVGTGFNERDSIAIAKKLSALETKTSPFAGGGAVRKGRWSKRAKGSERWVKPALVAEVRFVEWTPDAQIRHASFEGLRADKDPATIQRERPAGGSRAVLAPLPRASGIKVSHGDRVIDSTTGLTKLDLVLFYERIAPFILPHLSGRPVSLVRGPNGISGELFFQKHGEKIGIKGIEAIPASFWPGHTELLTVPSAQALIGAAQVNVIEFHTWNTTKKTPTKPDRMIFDLDPGEGVTWGLIQEAAQLTRGFLQQLELESWLKTSGGKGLHVVVPLQPKHDFDTVAGLSGAIVAHIAKTISSRFVAKSGGRNRVGKIFIDYLRNTHGATTAAAFSARARPGLGVSMPVAWSTLEKLTGGDQWNIRTAAEHAESMKADPWAKYFECHQSLGEAIDALAFEPSRKTRSVEP